MPTGNSGDLVKIGEWLVDPTLDTISRGAETHKLEPRTMRLLLCLAESAGAVVSLDRLLTEVWSGVVVGSASVYQAVSQLRKLLGDSDPNPTYIATVPRKGYRLIAPVRRIEQGASTPTPETLSAVPPRRRGLRLALAGAALVVLVLAGAWIFRTLPSGRPASSIASIAVLP